MTRTTRWTRHIGVWASVVGIVAIAGWVGVICLCLMHTCLIDLARGK